MPLQLWSSSSITLIWSPLIIHNSTPNIEEDYKNKKQHDIFPVPRWHSIWNAWNANNRNMYEKSHTYQVLGVMYSVDMCHTSQIQSKLFMHWGRLPLNSYSQEFRDKMNTSLGIYGSMAVDLVSACINRLLLREMAFKKTIFQNHTL